MVHMKKVKKPKVYNTKGRCIAAIRKVWRWHPMRKEVKARCKTAEGFYRCEKCRKLCPEIEIDHIIPAVDPVKGWEGFDKFIERLFCDINNLEGKCHECHKKKSGKENKVRKTVRKSKKTVDKSSILGDHELNE